MELLTDKVSQVFDLDAVKKGDLIRARYKSWPEAKNGVVAKATEKQLTVLHIPDASNISNYFPILAADVAAGDWGIRWSHDLELILGELPADTGAGVDLDGDVDDEF